MPRELSRNEKIVLAVLAQAKRPMSAYQILDADGVREQGVRAPLTVYRALGKLMDSGRVHRIESLNAFVVCEHEPHVEPAAFMICNDCKRTIEVETEGLQTSLLREAKDQGFKVQRMNIEISGRCDACEADD
ncbi:MAG: Fur family transcriptional regulator [Pseudomonadota bacterium]